MFKKLFQKYRKYKVEDIKPIEELERDWTLIKQQHAQLATSDLYALFKEYYLTRIELNRDKLEKHSSHDETLRVRCENEVMRRFMIDIEDMNVD